MYVLYRVVKSRRLLLNIAAYLVSIGRLLCLAFLYRWRSLITISLDWPLALTTQPSTSKLSAIPALDVCLVSRQFPSSLR